MATRREISQYPRPSKADRPQAICCSIDPVRGDLGCGRVPSEIDEYDPMYTSDPTDTDAARLPPDDYVWAEEGTLNHTNGHFLCTDCYIRAGQPSDPYGWVAN